MAPYFLWVHSLRPPSLSQPPAQSQLSSKERKGSGPEDPRTRTQRYDMGPMVLGLFGVAGMDLRRHGLL